MSEPLKPETIPQSVISMAEARRKELNGEIHFVVSKKRRWGMTMAYNLVYNTQDAEVDDQKLIDPSCD